MKNIVSILLIAGILLLVNILSNQFFFRLDLTEDRQYTLSKATKNILKSLEDPVTITAYFSEDLPPDYTKVRRDFRDMLVEFGTLSKGAVEYEFVDPNTDPQLEQEIVQYGVRPILFNTREKDQVTQKRGFMSAIVRMGENQQEVIPFIASGVGMEYSLATSIKKLAVLDKPSVGLLQGHGEPGLQELSQAFQQLSVLYNVENIDLGTETSIADRFKAVAIVAPSDTIPPDHLAKLDDYLSRGGRLFIAYNAVNGDLSTAQGSAISTGLESWLAGKGLEVESSFITDVQCASVTVQQQQGFFTVQTPVQFPYLPLVSNFPEHPITKGLEQVIMQFVSPVRFLGDSSAAFTPIAYTTGRAGIVRAPTFFDINKKWADPDFPLANLVIGGILEAPSGGSPDSKIILFGDGDFPITGQQGRGQGEDNISLMVNSIDWLSDDTGLIELRTKGVATRPISDEYIGEEAEGKRSFIKYLNFGLPILLVLLYGFFRFQQQQRRRIRRMQERYV